MVLFRRVSIALIMVLVAVLAAAYMFTVGPASPLLAIIAAIVAILVEAFAVRQFSGVE